MIGIAVIGFLVTEFGSRADSVSVPTQNHQEAATLQQTPPPLNIVIEGETELGWLSLFVWQLNTTTNEISLGIQLDGVGIPLGEFVDLFS